LEIKDWRYEAPFINMLIRGQNIQGETGMVSTKSKPTSLRPSAFINTSKKPTKDNKPENTV